MKSMIAILVTAAALFANATGKVNNGVLPETVLYQCTEINNANSPIYELLEKGRLGFVLQVTSPAGDLLAQNDVYRNTDIRCILPCDVYENKKLDLAFHVTLIPSKEQPVISAGYSLNGESVSLDCVQPSVVH